MSQPDSTVLEQNPNGAAAAPAPASGHPRLWSGLTDGAEDRAGFCRDWLALQCGMIDGAVAGLLLLREQAGTDYRPIASWPDASRDLGDLARMAERAIAERRSVAAWGRTDPGTNQPQPVGLLIAHPILEGQDDGQPPFGAVAVAVAAPRGPVSVDPQAVAGQLHWGAGWLGSLLWRERAETHLRTIARAGAGLDLLAVAGEHRRLKASAIAVANELAARFCCDRVSIGLEKHGRIRVLAMSHSASFQRKSQLVDAIENAMEEALDQNVSVAEPPITSAERHITVAHRRLLKATDARRVASVVVTSRRRSLGAITMERHRDEPFDTEALKLCETVASLVGPVIDLQADGGRWIAGRIVDFAGDGIKALVGRRRPALKLAAIGVAGVAAFLAFAEVGHRVAGKSVIEGVVQRAAVAPFDGFVLRAPMRAGDTVREGDLLAALDDKDLVLDRLKWRSERDKLLQKQRDALGKHDRAALSVLTAQIQQAEAQLALAEDKLARSHITAPFDGIVVSGDLSQMLGSPVEKGKVLFEVAPLDAYRVVVQADERDIGYIRVGQTGTLALTGMPAQPVPLTVTKTTPVAISEEGRNYFRVEAGLGDSEVPMRPGMEGVAKIEAGRRALLWVWTHSLVEWAQLTAWKWLP
jgi:multidrug efflux pump subunit AcrA (membrane-fusion protein)